MGTGSFSGVKRPGRGVDHPPPSSAEVKERVALYLGLRGLFWGAGLRAVIIFVPTSVHLASSVHLKDKAVPLQAWTGPEASRRLRLPDFKTIVTRRW